MPFKELLVVSGKGGTGKTTLAGALVEIYRRSNHGVIAVDADVDAANLALILNTESVDDENEFIGGERAFVDEQRCTGCGECLKHCRFEALISVNGVVEVDELACVGCRVCRQVCPAGAVEMRPNIAGRWFCAVGDGYELVHAELGIAQSNSGKLVARVRREARRRAEEADTPLIVIDGPPGIGCPVHAAMAGVDLVLAVTEPSPSGLHDLQRLLETARHFSRPIAVILNKAGLGYGGGRELEALLEEHQAPLLARLPFDRAVPAALARGEGLSAVPGFVERVAALRLAVDELLA